MAEKKIIGFKGKNYVASKLTTNKLHITKDDLYEVKENKPMRRYIIDRKTGELIHIDLNVGKINKNSSTHEKLTAYNPLVMKNFGVKRVTSKQLVNFREGLRDSLKKYEIQNDYIEWGTPIRVTFVIEYYIFFKSSKNRWPKEKGTYLTLKINMPEMVSFEDHQELVEYFNEEVIEANPKISAFRRLLFIEDAEIIYGKIYAIAKNQARMRVDMEYGLYKQDPLKINIFTNTIEFKEYKNCVKNVLHSYYNKNGKGISSSSIDSIDDKNGVSIESINKFCKKYNIKTIAYDINKNILSKYVPEKPNKCYKSLIYVAYNNHIYPITNRFLTENKEAKYDSEEYIDLKQIKDRLSKSLEKKILPDDIKMNDLNIYSFVEGKKLYHTNSEYLDVLKIAKIYGIEEKLDPSVNLSMISDYIEKLYSIKSTKSFFPYELGFNGGYNHCSKKFRDEYDDCIDVKGAVTIDNNKHYTYALYCLENLISIDIRDTKIVKCTGRDIELNDNYIYIAKPKQSSILMPCNDFYIGYELKYCTEQGLEYEITHELQATATKNHFKQMIDDAKNKLTNDLFKEVMNRMIGRFNGNFGEKTSIKFLKIANKDELSVSSDYHIKLNDNYSVVFDIEKSCHDIYNRRPIRHQILFQARKIIYEKMKELKITDDNLIKIKTDAITYVCTKKQESSKEFGSWKIEDKSSIPMDMTDSIPNEEITLDVNPINDKNTIWMDYAGSGKTYHIINNLIPTLKQKYIVLTPSHSASKDYKKNDINCSVIQKYTFRLGSKVDEDIIIVDEIGMVNKAGYDFLIRSALSGKIIYAFGDFSQLPPPSESRYYTENNQILINILFAHRKSLGTNYRNNFTVKYYDSLIHSKDNNYLTEQVKKYSSDNYKTAKAIICFTNDTRKKYNNLMLQHLGIKKFDVGCKIVCKTNDLAEFEIYNNFYYTVTKNDGEWVELSDGVDKYDLELKDLEKYNSKSKSTNFDLGYARTVYNIQGESIKSFYYAPEDHKWLDGVTTYTVISRLKTK